MSLRSTTGPIRSSSSYRTASTRRFLPRQLVAPRQCLIGGVLVRRNRRTALICRVTCSARVVGDSPDPDPSPCVSVALSRPLQLRASQRSAPCYRGREPSAARVPFVSSRCTIVRARPTNFTRSIGVGRHEAVSKNHALSESVIFGHLRHRQRARDWLPKGYPVLPTSPSAGANVAPTICSPKGEHRFLYELPLGRPGARTGFFGHALGSLQCTDRSRPSTPLRHAPGV